MHLHVPPEDMHRESQRPHRGHAASPMTHNLCTRLSCPHACSPSAAGHNPRPSCSLLMPGLSEIPALKPDAAERWRWLGGGRAAVAAATCR